MAGTVNEVAQIVRTRDGFIGIVWMSATAPQFELKVIPVPELSGVTEVRSDRRAGEVGAANGRLAPGPLRPPGTRGAWSSRSIISTPWKMPMPGTRHPRSISPQGPMLLPAIEDAVKQFASEGDHFDQL